MYLLGGKPGVAEDAGPKLAGRLSGAENRGLASRLLHRSGPEPEITAQIRQASPQMLLVAKGSPFCRKSGLTRHWDELPGVTCFGVGGLLDFLALRVPRAPLVVRKMGMEWGWRFLMEPRRMWKRYLVGNGVYIRNVAHAYLQRNQYKNRRNLHEIPAQEAGFPLH